jgi:hypothetical protein
MSKVGNFDPNYKEQQSKKKAPSGSDKCVTADKLGGMLDVAKFNKMMSKTTDTANAFLTSYIKEQQDKLPDKSSLELERYKQTALNKKRSMIEKHESMMSKLNQLFEYYKHHIQNSTRIEELYTMLTDQNKKLKQGVEREIHMIEISDRKTYYENEENESASWWSNVFSMLYKYLIVLVIVAIVLKNRYREHKMWGIVAGMVLYPTVIYFIIDILMGIYKWIISNTKWVYLHP